MNTNRPKVIYKPRKPLDQHRWCELVEITLFGDIERRFLDNRCDECFAQDEEHAK